MVTVAGNSRKEAVWGASVRVLWWFSESTELTVFPPPHPGEEPQKNQAGGGEGGGWKTKMMRMFTL